MPRLTHACLAAGLATAAGAHAQGPADAPAGDDPYAWLAAFDAAVTQWTQRPGDGVLVGHRNH